MGDDDSPASGKSTCVLVKRKVECGAGIWVRPLLYAPEGVVHSFVNSDRNVEFGKGTLAAY